MNTYILLCENKIYFHNTVNKRGFTEDEVKEIKYKEKFCNARKICIEEEVEKYNLMKNYNNDYGMDESVYNFYLWSNAYNDNNINGFSVPMKAQNNDDYVNKLKSTFDHYIKYLDRPAFAYYNDLLNCIKNECKLILEALDYLINEDIENGDSIMSQMIELFQEDPFLISELDKSYSFRCIAPFLDLHSQGCSEHYKEMMKEKLTFFRIRTKKKDSSEKISQVKDMLHLPYDMREKAGNMRFSSSGSPGLYLSATTYVCSKECNWDIKNEELYASAFIPNEQGKHFKILNLTISQALINGIFNRGMDGCDDRRNQLQLSMLKIFPLVIATSFTLESETNNNKYNYLLSQSLMRVANKHGIDGIAYLSMKGSDEFQFPQGVNLAIPATDISNQKMYSEKCKGFEVSIPVKYAEQKEDEIKSYINKVFKRYTPYGIESFTSKIDVDGEYQYYGETKYGKFDNYLVSLLKRHSSLEK